MHSEYKEYWSDYIVISAHTKKTNPISNRQNFLGLTWAITHPKLLFPTYSSAGDGLKQHLPQLQLILTHQGSFFSEFVFRFPVKCLFAWLCNTKIIENIWTIAVQAGFKRRRDSFAKSVFDRFCEASSIPGHSKAVIPKSKLRQVLKELDIVVDETDFDGLFHEYNFQEMNVHEIEFDEFLLLAERPRIVDEWARSLPLADVLADAIPRIPEVDPLQVIRRLSSDEISTICRVILPGIERILFEAVSTLKAQFQPGENRNLGTESKFNLIPISCGTIADFHKGVQGRIGLTTQIAPVRNAVC